MIFVFLVDTSASMEQALSADQFSAKKRDDSQADEWLFGGDKDRVSRRWQRKEGGVRTRPAGSTRLDCAKSIVEQIISNRSTYEHDRYMLVTYGSSSSSCIRASLKDSRATLLAELRKLSARDRFGGGVSLTALFNQLAVLRGAYDLDTYGFGRYLALSEAVHIVWLTDGASVVTAGGVQNRLHLPVSSTPWGEAYAEPFRWDQRLVLVLLHAAGDALLCAARPLSSESALAPMCAVMGGSVHHVGAMHQAQRFVDAFAPARAAQAQAGRALGAAAAAPGVLVNFERIDDNPAAPGNSDLRVLVHATPCAVTSGPLPPADASAASGAYGNSAGLSALISGQLGYFPIPEAFWPEAVVPPPQQLSAQDQSRDQSRVGSPQIQRRAAHPTLGYSQAGVEWAVPAQFPFDKYQIDTHSNVAQKLLAAAAAAQAAHEAQGGRGPCKPVCWAVFVSGSYTAATNSGFPFGMLRPNTARTAVNLFVLPYNYAALWKVLARLDAQAQAQHVSRGVAAMQPAWRREFEEYLLHTPGYYAIPLKRAFNLYGIPHAVFPKTFGQSAGMRCITQYSLRLHGVARREWARIPSGCGAAAEPSAGAVALALQRALTEFGPASDASHLVANAFDVDRDHCLATLSAMRRVFVRECMAQPLDVAARQRGPGWLVDVASEDDRDTRHSVPIRDMGEYSAALHHMKLHEARDPLLDERVAMQQRRNMFGNPYRRAPREPRGPGNNVLARNPELSAKLGQPRPASVAAAAAAAAARADVEDETAALEIESEAEINELAIDKMLDDNMPGENDSGSGAAGGGDDGSGSGANGSDANGSGGRFWWMQRQDVPRRRSINAPWRKNDHSWNVNPWASDRCAKTDDGYLGALTFTSDARLIDRHTGDFVSEDIGEKPDDSPPSEMLVESSSSSADSEPVVFEGEQPTTERPFAETLAGVGDDDGSVSEMEGVEEAAVAATGTATLPPAPKPEATTLAVRKVNVAEEKVWFLKRIKADPARYDEEAVLQRLAELQNRCSSAELSKPQLKIIVGAAIAAAKAMRRKQLVVRLESAGAHI